MSKAFSTKFILVNDIQQVLDPSRFLGGPWIHIATAVRGMKEYMCFKHSKTGQTYIEEWDSKVEQLNRIKSDAEFEDISGFFGSLGLLDIRIDKEFKVAKQT